MFLEKILNLIAKNNNKLHTEYYSNSKTSKTLLIYKKYLETNQPLVVLVDSKKSAENLQHSLLNFMDEVYIYPEIDTLKRYIKKSNDLELVSLKILNDLLNHHKIIVIIPVVSLFRTVKKPQDLLNYNIELSLDNYIEFSKLTDKLIDMGYCQVEIVENIGEFSKRGSIIDIYSPLSKNPVRLDYFDEELDSIKSFDTISQKSNDKLEEVRIYPNGDFFLNKKEKSIIINKLEQALNDQALEKEESFVKIKENLLYKINLYKETGLFDELESFVNYIYNDVYSIVDYIDKNSIIFIDNYTKVLSKVNEVKDYFSLNLESINDRYIYQNIIDENSFDKLRTLKNEVVYLSHFKSNEKFIEEYINLDFNELSFFNSSEELAKELKDKLKKDYEIVILLSTNKQKDYVEKLLFDYNLYDDVFIGIERGKIHIELSHYDLHGFEHKQNKFLLISQNEIFRDKISKKKRVSFQFKNSEKIRNYQDLNIGDYIVHIHHGIGIYQGIENIEVLGVHKDFLKIAYKDSDVIYVDIENMKYVQKYTASTDTRKPELNKLGTKKWSQVKHKVRKEIQDISEELIKLYIRRELNKGYAFSKDSTLQKEFESDFLFEATADQVKATKEIKEDMEKERPMDRLLCGDVGFGKTEVAMRAAFKAVIDNKQVAILVPTTLLAEQHYDNFVYRFRNFPINIEVVSRFKTTKEINDIIKKLAAGKIDIIIGTHKLLNDKFKYNDLGLLIIDEEQRFGVKHKEKIKHLKNLIDVLTLSATPIPRTLHMSLIGIRDLSLIETPPVDRQEIQTFVTSYNPNIIREAVLNEINRSGQVFYVYNRVDSIEEKYLELKKLLPEVNIAFAHGRMTQKELENIMTDLINKEYDMLITTTIIETGIDISNVNTLIVEDADKFGLSQLYQIRGRVGRSSREAYAYFMYKPFKHLTENSEKRLAAIKNFTSLGSGFKIAMQDLSIRGAGDMLGGKQHGFIDSVGYTLYSQMLEKEITDKKEILIHLLKEEPNQDVTYYENKIKENIKKDIDIFDIEDSSVEIKLNVEAYIPKDYINNDGDKLYFYKLLNNASSIENLEEIIEEMIDRFSDFEIEVENLLNITKIKILSENTYVSNIRELANKVVINFKKEILEVLDGKKLFEKTSKYSDMTIQVKESLILEINKTNQDILKSIINSIIAVKDSVKL